MHVHESGVQADDVGRRHSISFGENWRTRIHKGESGTKHWSWIRSTKRGLVKKNVEGFRYKPKGYWFYFAVNKTWLSWDLHILISAYATSHIMCWNATLSWSLVWKIADYGLESFKYGYLSYKSALTCFRRPLLTPRSCLEDFFMMDWCSLSLIHF